MTNTNGRKSKYLDILKSSKLSLNGKTHRMTALLREVVGQNISPEAFALIMGRNINYCYQHQKLVDDVCYVINEEDDILLKLYGFQKNDLLNFLVDCKVIVISFRIIEVQAFFRQIYQEGLALYLDDETKSCLMNTRYGCFMIIFDLVTKSSISQTLKEQFSATNIVTTLTFHFENEPSAVLACLVLTILRSMLERFKTKNFFAKYLSDYDIVKLGRLLSKDAFSNRLVSWKKKGIENIEKVILTSTLVDNFDGFVYLNSVTNSQDASRDNVAFSLSKWIMLGFDQCSIMVCTLLEPGPTRNRKPVTVFSSDEKCVEALGRWCRMPAYYIDDLNRSIMCTKIIGYLLLNNLSLAKKLMKNYDFEKSVEIGIKHASHQLAQFYIICIGSLTTIGTNLWHSIVNNKVIMQCMIKSCFSPNRDLQQMAILVTSKLIDDKTTANVVKAGLGLKEVYLLESGFDKPINYEAILRMRKAVEKYLDTHNDEKRDVPTSDDSDDSHFKRCMEAVKFKDLGNQTYNDGNHKLAIDYYSKGLEFSSPSFTQHYSSDNKKNSKSSAMIIEITQPKYSETKWDLFLAQLHSNRAQCYLTVKQYASAVQDCNIAVIMCDREKDEGKSLLCKTTMRRSLAYLELGKLTESLADIGFCLILEPNNNYVKTHFSKIINKFYQKVGPENLVRRCTHCLKGEGEKLKRCANCEERYCSRDCQLEAWESGHKNLCPKLHSQK